MNSAIHLLKLMTRLSKANLNESVMDIKFADMVEEKKKVSWNVREVSSS